MQQNTDSIHLDCLSKYKFRNHLRKAAAITKPFHFPFFIS